MFTPTVFFLASIGDRDFFVQDGLIECRNKGGEVMFVSDEKGGESIFQCKDLYVGAGTKIRVFDETTGTFKKQISGYKLFHDNYISECSLLVADYRKGSPSRLTRLNLQSVQVEWTIDFSRGANCLIDNETVYLERIFDNKSLYAIDLKGGNILWQFDVSQFGFFIDHAQKEEIYSIVQVVGVLENLVWVLITGGRLLALDTQTGQLIQELDFNQVFGRDYHVRTKMFLDKERKKIIWLPNALIHIDLVSLKCTVIREYFKDVEKKDKWRFGDRILHNNKFFFSGDFGMFNPIVLTFIGIMDANTGDILWKTQLLKSDGISHFGLHVSGNRIYARDGKGSLHVFEQEVDF